MEIKKVTPEDAKELLEIYAPYVEKTAISFELEVPSVEEFKKRIENISRKYPYIKAVDESGRILGYAYAGCFKDREAYDWSVETTIYIREDAHRKGSGRALYDALETSLSGMGILNANACIAMPKQKTDPGNPEEFEQDPYLTADSYYFHKKMGYQLAGTFHDSGFKFGRWYDMIWMEKMLGAHTTEPGKVRFGEWTITRYG